MAVAEEGYGQASVPWDTWKLEPFTQNREIDWRFATRDKMSDNRDQARDGGHEDPKPLSIPSHAWASLAIISGLALTTMYGEPWSCRQSRTLSKTFKSHTTPLPGYCRRTSLQGQ